MLIDLVGKDHKKHTSNTSVTPHIFLLVIMSERLASPRPDAMFSYGSWFVRTLATDTRDDHNLDTVSGLHAAHKEAACCKAQRKDRDVCVSQKGLGNCGGEVESFYKCLLTEGGYNEEVAQRKKVSKTQE